MSLPSLPNELLEEVLRDTNYDDTISFCRTNKQYSEICKDPIFWDRKANFLIEKHDIDDPGIMNIIDPIKKFLTIQAYEKVGDFNMFNFIYENDICMAD